MDSGNILKGGLTNGLCNGYVYVNPSRVILEEGTLIDIVPPQDCSLGKPAMYFLD